MDLYYITAAEQRGPVSSELLISMISSGKLRSSVLVWRDGMKDFVPASDVPDLASLITAALAPPVSTEPLPDHGPCVDPQEPVPSSSQGSAVLGDWSLSNQLTATSPETHHPPPYPRSDHRLMQPQKLISISKTINNNDMTWYYSDDKTQVGPVDESEIFKLSQSGIIKRNTLVWKEGTPAWCEAECTELVRHMAPESPPMIPRQNNNPPPMRQDSVKATWYYSDGKAQVGPVDESEILKLSQSGIIKRSTQVWKEGTPAWCEAGHTELVSHMAPEPPPMIPPSTGYAKDSVANLGFIQPNNPPRSVGWMTFWGIVWPGLGQLLCGQKTKGIVLMLASAFGHIVTGGVLSIPFCVIGGLDAYKVAKALRSDNPVREWEFFPNSTDP